MVGWGIGQDKGYLVGISECIGWRHEVGYALLREGDITYFKVPAMRVMSKPMIS